MCVYINNEWWRETQRKIGNDEGEEEVVEEIKYNVCMYIDI